MAGTSVAVTERLSECSCLKLAPSVPTFKLLFWPLPVLLGPELEVPGNPSHTPHAAPQVLLPMAADLRAHPLPPWTPKNHPHSLLMVKHLLKPSHCDPWLFWTAGCLPLPDGDEGLHSCLLETTVGESTSPKTCSATGRSF